MRASYHLEQCVASYLFNLCSWESCVTWGTTTVESKGSLWACYFLVSPWFSTRHSFFLTFYFLNQICCSLDWVENSFYFMLCSMSFLTYKLRIGFIRHLPQLVNVGSFSGKKKTISLVSLLSPSPWQTNYCIYSTIARGQNWTEVREGNQPACLCCATSCEPGSCLSCTEQPRVQCAGTGH